jgi:uncharacterized protein (TIGR03086 family)
MTEPEIDLLSGVLRQAEAVMVAVEPDQLDDPTPCPDYDVARLLDHLVGWARSFAARLSGEASEDDPNDYRAGDDPAAEFHVAAQTIITGYRAGGDAAEQLPVGILVPEFLTHSWDLARATGQQLVADPAAAELGLATVRSMLKPEYRGGDGSFGPEVAVDADAPALDRLVGFMGRDPGWAPAA